MRAVFFPLIVFIALAEAAVAQGTFVYDQQSSTDETPFPGDGGTIQQGSPGIGQTFTPALSGIDFIKLKFSDYNPTNGVGATAFLNLRSNSLGGAILASTAAVTMTNGFAGVAAFFFSSTVPLTPGVIYLFEPVAQSGDQWRIDGGEYRYPGGMAFYQGQALPGGDFWFREGIFIPEPSSALLIMFGVVALASRRLRKRR